MSKHTIYPYASKWSLPGVKGEVRVWVFDDPSKGLINEGLVAGTDDIMDRLASRFPDGENGFKLSFADQPFDGHDLIFDWVRSDIGKDLGAGIGGNWYKNNEMNIEGWLCPALGKYFKKPPKHIYVQAEQLTGELKRGTGKVIIQKESESISTTTIAMAY